MSEKPHLGRIVYWRLAGLCVVGDFLDHPTLKGKKGITSPLVNAMHLNPTDCEVETQNSRYTLQHRL